MLHAESPMLHAAFSCILHAKLKSSSSIKHGHSCNTTESIIGIERVHFIPISHFLTPLNSLEKRDVGHLWLAYIHDIRIPFPMALWYKRHSRSSGYFELICKILKIRFATYSILVVVVFHNNIKKLVCFFCKMQKVNFI